MWLTAIPVFVFDKCSNRKVDSLCCQCLMWSVIINCSSISIITFIISIYTENEKFAVSSCNFFHNRNNMIITLLILNGAFS